jgi:small-conductance mechanosensitive channel
LRKGQPNKIRPKRIDATGWFLLSVLINEGKTICLQLTDTKNSIINFYQKMKNALLILLLLIAIAMIFIAFKGGIPAPGLTGLGFMIIATLLYKGRD